MSKVEIDSAARCKEALKRAKQGPFITKQQLKAFMDDSEKQWAEIYGCYMREIQLQRRRLRKAGLID